AGTGRAMNVKRVGAIAGRIALVLASILVVLGALEVTLRWRPTLLGQAFANGAASKYTLRPGGIYYSDRALGMRFMLPNHRTTMYYNGYVWQHETDALGFRNKPLHVPADVVLLGDSVVYGHGVDFEHTIGHYLERRTGLRVANLGRQADCAFQEAYLLTEYLPVFRPRVVVHVFTANDIEDLYVLLRDEAMHAFLAQPVERITYPPRTDPATLLAERERDARRRSLRSWAKQELYVMKMFRWLDYRFRQWRRTAAVTVAEAASAHSRRYDPDEVNRDPESLGWRYTAHALAYMKHLSDRAGARLVMVPLARDRQLEILRSIAARHAIDLVDTSALYAGPSFLPNDGHFTPHGARTMADLIAADIARQPPPR
ncbi:MAG: hypothetical protein ACREKH_21395, partial [Candidatus Rokuibacteriota bacterium]